MSGPGLVVVEMSADEYADGAAADMVRIAEACDAADGVSTLNEQTQLELKHRGLRDARLWLAVPRVGSGTADAVGFALLHHGALDLAVHPEERAQGAGTALATASLATVDRVEAWSHADHPAAARIAERFGIPRARELVVMSRPTSEPLPEVPVPDDVRVTTYSPADADELLRVNAAAFAHHPEQGRMTRDDLRERTTEGWFDPGGLFLAKDGDGTVLGFHWTKLHRDEEPAYGEVYVVAVDPSAAGRGLGRLLTDIGLHHLADAGVGSVMLYVDGDNGAALALYRGSGFTELRREVQYRGMVRRSRVTTTP